MADLASKITEAIHEFLMETDDLYCAGHLVKRAEGPDCEQLAVTVMGLVSEEHPDGEPCFRCGHASMAEHGPGGCVSCGCPSPFGGLT